MTQFVPDHQTTAGSNGSLLAHKYRIIEQISFGCFGRVLKVYDEDLDRFFAAKVLTPDAADSGESIRRLAREAQILCKLHHPNVVQVYSSAIDERQGLVMIMDLLDGTALSKVISESSQLAVPRAVAIAGDMARGLQAAHECGILHRDLKPANVMLVTTDGAEQAILIDFGIAKLQMSDQKLTKTGTVLGTPLYMSPEQFVNQPLDARSDIYSLGCVLYEMVAGVPPITGESAVELASRHSADAPAPPSLYNRSVPRWLDKTILRCLEKEPANRFQSAGHLLQALSLLVDHQPDGASTGRPTLQWGRRLWQPRSVALIVVAAAALAALATVAWQHQPAGLDDVKLHDKRDVIRGLVVDGATPADLQKADALIEETIRAVRPDTPADRYVHTLYHLWAISLRMQGRYDEALSKLGKERDGALKYDQKDDTGLESGLDAIGQRHYEEAQKELSVYLQEPHGIAEQFAAHEARAEAFVFQHLVQAQRSTLSTSRYQRFAVSDALGEAEKALGLLDKLDPAAKSKEMHRLHLQLLQAEASNAHRQFESYERGKQAAKEILQGVRSILKSVTDTPEYSLARARFMEAAAETDLGRDERALAVFSANAARKSVQGGFPSVNQWQKDTNQRWSDYIRIKLKLLGL